MNIVSDDHLAKGQTTVSRGIAITWKYLLPGIPAIAILLGAFSFILIQILRLNQGFFTYILDDAYIHLALAENIARGTYGVNLGEFAATSSSILWPFLLTPFARFELAPLILNLLAAFCFLVVCSRILLETLNIVNPRIKSVLVTCLLIFIIAATNLLPIIFMGMEHSLQFLVIAIIAYGLVLNVTRDETRNWLWAAIFLAPLIRFENSTVALAALIFLFLRQQRLKSMIVSAAVGLSLAGFSIFLIANGQSWLPASILAKSGVNAGTSVLASVIHNLAANSTSYFGIFAVTAAILLLVYAIFSKSSASRRMMALVTFLATVLHLIFGGVRMGRYEGYSWLFVILVILFLTGRPVARWINAIHSGRRSVIFALLAGLMLLIPALPNIWLLSLTPSGSNNIYSQHYQMHRFVTDFYKAPVAVNDLGYIAYKNDFYVLDLWGLASREALQSRNSGHPVDWMSQLAASHHVELVMIYADWFPNVPVQWQKVGELVLSSPRVTVAGERVTFFAVSSQARVKIDTSLRDFIPTLPPSAEFIFADQALTINN